MFGFHKRSQFACKDPDCRFSRCLAFNIEKCKLERIKYQHIDRQVELETGGF